jgi:putative transposase
VRLRQNRRGGGGGWATLTDFASYPLEGLASVWVSAPRRPWSSSLRFGSAQSPGAAAVARGRLEDEAIRDQAKAAGDEHGARQALRAERRNQVWALDFIFDSTSDGRPIKALAMCDEHTRESIGRRLGRSITADDVVDVLDQAKAERGAPECIRMDNGPELIANAIRDWCRLSGTGTIYIEPGSPWENPFVESFNARLCDELFNREIFDSVFEAKVLYFDWCDVYNNFRPHSSLGYLAPAMFAALLHGKLPTPELQTR